MMLSEEFAAAQSATIAWRGLTVYSMYEAGPLVGSHVIEVQVLDVSRGTRQGLSLRAVGGQLRPIDLEGEPAEQRLLWADFAPHVVRYALEPTHDGGDVGLRAWNSWETNGVTHAWIGNAGMLVDHSDGSVVLRCSDGNGDAEFEDLVVKIVWAAGAGLEPPS